MIEVHSYIDVDNELISIYDLDKDLVIDCDPSDIWGGIDLSIDHDSLLKTGCSIVQLWWIFAETLGSVLRRRSRTDILDETSFRLKVLSNNAETIDILRIDEWDKTTKKL